jgi:hypothetical protein
MADSINNRFTYIFQCVCRVVSCADKWLRFFELVALRTGDSFLSSPTEQTTVPLSYHYYHCGTETTAHAQYPQSWPERSHCSVSVAHSTRFLDLGTSWKWMVSFTPRPLYPRGKSPRYPLDRRLGGPQSQSGRYEEVKIIPPTRTRTPTFWSSSP